MMGRAGRDCSGQRGGESYRGHGARSTRDDRWQPAHHDDDPRRDMSDHDELQDPANDDYIWPEYEEEDDD
ncbi:hypothetical protein [uncultured Methanoregula sp.]|uniref:hypothetical protein n=1 Tax=uncultured Methanoregula sp. TaxID=1005933 RepID=UPI002AABECDA|nr:hypothetical protein [uncultured Methanoregula sp.]